MSYASASDLVKRFGVTQIAQVATPERFNVVAPDLLVLTINGGDTSAYTADEIEAANEAMEVISTALTDADNEIELYLTQRYTLPFNPIPDVLVGIACNIARYYLYQAGAGDEENNRYKASIKTLEKLANGQIRLGVAQDNQEVSTTSNIPESTTPGRVFTSDSLKDF